MARSRSPSQKSRDRRLIAEFYLTGYSQMAIRQAMKEDHNITISQATISRDLDEIQEQWKQTTTLDIDKAKVNELQKIDRVERELWKGWNRSYGHVKKKTAKVKDSDDKGHESEKTVQEWEQAGDPRFLLGILQCIEKRCRILGIEEVGDINIFNNITFAQFTKRYFGNGGSQ